MSRRALRLRVFNMTSCANGDWLKCLYENLQRCKKECHARLRINLTWHFRKATLGTKNRHAWILNWDRNGSTSSRFSESKFVLKMPIAILGEKREFFVSKKVNSRRKFVKIARARAINDAQRLWFLSEYHKFNFAPSFHQRVSRHNIANFRWWWLDLMSWGMAENLFSPLTNQNRVDSFPIACLKVSARHSSTKFLFRRKHRSGL